MYSWPPSLSPGASAASFAHSHSSSSSSAPQPEKSSPSFPRYIVDTGGFGLSHTHKGPEREGGKTGGLGPGRLKPLGGPCLWLESLLFLPLLVQGRGQPIGHTVDFHKESVGVREREREKERRGLAALQTTRDVTMTASSCVAAAATTRKRRSAWARRPSVRTRSRLYSPEGGRGRKKKSGESRIGLLGGRKKPYCHPFIRVASLVADRRTKAARRTDPSISHRFCGEFETTTYAFSFVRKEGRKEGGRGEADGNQSRKLFPSFLSVPPFSF